MFWERFYKLCEKKGEKPLQVVKKIGIAAGSITSWKNGSIPSGVNLCLISDYFNVSIDYLLGRSDMKDIEYEIYKLIEKIYDSILREKNGELKLKLLFMRCGESETRADQIVFFIKHRKEIINTQWEQVELTEEDFKDYITNEEHPEIRLKRIEELEDLLNKLEG